MLRRTLAIACAVAGLAGPALAQGSAPATLTAQSFSGGTTADLATLCGATGNEPVAIAAVAYCHGFLAGVGQLHTALTGASGPLRSPYCVPDPRPSISQVAANFVAWSRANPQHAGDSAAVGLTRFAHVQYPCAARPAAARSAAARRG